MLTSPVALSTLKLPDVVSIVLPLILKLPVSILVPSINVVFAPDSNVIPFGVTMSNALALNTTCPVSWST